MILDIIAITASIIAVAISLTTHETTVWVEPLKGTREPGHPPKPRRPLPVFDKDSSHEKDENQPIHK